MLRSSFVLVLVSIAAHAAEVDCPLRAPFDPSARLISAEPQVGGANVGEPPDVLRVRGDRSQSTTFFDFWNSSNSALVCFYEKDGRLAIPVPGILTRCDSIERKVPVTKGEHRVGNVEAILLRVWCTSRP